MSRVDRCYTHKATGEQWVIIVDTGSFVRVWNCRLRRSAENEIASNCLDLYFPDYAWRIS